MINPQEVMMALSPEERLAHAHRLGGEQRQAAQCHASAAGSLLRSKSCATGVISTAVLVFLKKNITHGL